MKIIRAFSKPLLYTFSLHDEKIQLKMGSGHGINESELRKEYNTRLNINFRDYTFKELLALFEDRLTSKYFPKFLDFNFHNNINLNTQINDPDKKKYLEINVPVIFNSLISKNLLENLYLRPISINKSDIPQSLKDLKSYINSRTVLDEADLYNKILGFNVKSQKKILEMYKPTRDEENKNFVWSDNDDSIRMY